MARLPTIGNDTGAWGSVLNDFLSVAHNPDGTLKSGGFTNPMQALGDLITGGALGAPGRLPVGPNGFFLGVVGGLPAWLPVPSGFSNPMNSLGDLITGGTSGIAQRLGVGGAGQVLGVSGGQPSWVANPAGFANPMTVAGDIITGGAAGAAQRLGIGAAGQVLGVSAGAPAWVTNPAGFANPMTAQSDLITGGIGGAAQRLPVGANGQFLGIAGGNLAWLPVPSSPFEVLVPSGDTTGAADDTAFNNAVAALPNGGTIFLLCGNTPYYTKNGWILPAQTTSGNFGGNPVSLQGIGFPQLRPVGANKTGLYYHRTSGYGAQYNPGANGAQPHVGSVKGIWISGLNATGASIGFDVGDGWGFDTDVYVSDFNGVGGIGCLITNRVFWTEKNSRFVIHASNNTQQIVMDAPIQDVSHEYNFYDFSIFCNQNQDGIVVKNGVNNGGCHMFIRGNMCQTTATSGAPANNCAMLKLLGSNPIQTTANSRFYNSQIWVKVEFNQTSQYTTGSVPPWTVYSDGVGQIKQCTGHITCSLNGIQMNGAEFTFSGMLSRGDIPPANGGTGGTASSLWATTPSLGSTWFNHGPDALVVVTGGTVTGMTINQTATALTTGCVFVGAGGSLLISGSVAPAITVIPARSSES